MNNWGAAALDVEQYRDASAIRSVILECTLIHHERFSHCRSSKQGTRSLNHRCFQSAPRWSGNNMGFIILSIYRPVQLRYRPVHFQHGHCQVVGSAEKNTYHSISWYTSILLHGIDLPLELQREAS